MTESFRQHAVTSQKKTPITDLKKKKGGKPQKKKKRGQPSGLESLWKSWLGRILKGPTTENEDRSFM